jgi:hypothetical protein
MIVPAASKIARSRAGNGDPSFKLSGNVSTPASVTAPRTPAIDVAATSRQLGFVARRPWRVAVNRVKRNEAHTHRQRKAASAPLIART